jgi:hypothetical protein
VLDGRKIKILNRGIRFKKKWINIHLISDLIMHLLNHYHNICSSFDNTYDGGDFYIPPYHHAILVPCNSEHQDPSMCSCLLLTRTGVQVAEKTSQLFIYIIDNDTPVGLLLKHGDLLGAYYTGPHAHIKAERCLMLISEYKRLIEEQQKQMDIMDDEDCFDNMDEVTPTCLPLDLCTDVTLTMFNDLSMN